MIDFFFSIKPDQHFTFSDECFELYRKYFKIYWHKKYKNILPGKENFYRTYMMQSWKFAIFYHFILGKTGNVIDGECWVFGMKISLLFAESMKKFFDYKVKPQHIEKAKSDLDKYVLYLNANTEIKIRDFTRKFNIKKAEAILDADLEKGGVSATVQLQAAKLVIDKAIELTNECYKPDTASGEAPQDDDGEEETGAVLSFTVVDGKK